MKNNAARKKYQKAFVLKPGEEEVLNSNRGVTKLRIREYNLIFTVNKEKKFGPFFYMRKVQER